MNETTKVTETRCPIAISREHEVRWMTVPGYFFNTEEIAPEHERGICLNCGEQFMR